MSESLHERYDRDERALLGSADSDLWANKLLDLVIDVAAPIFDAAQWREVPEGAGKLWTERATATNALSAMTMRLSRTIAMTVRSGYAAEALAGLRRIAEAAGHAQQVAEDESGQYAQNWLRDKGRASKPRAAFSPDRSDSPTWSLMSGQSHAEFAAFAALSATLTDERVLVHHIGPKRDPLWDNVWIWLTARQLGRVLAAVLKVHSHIDQADYIAVMTRVVEAEPQLEDELAKRSTK